ncbi:hypothetical protein F0344_12350 [Streptomyces finlayi]|uniref:Uncharacterized protein n=1 Tax=Streptomyces finlayi TaxID=67296 RepID=A0A7G7BIY5_9ACTN|nr:hypothetical protein [Streptomyces finlayi]QNE75300.1 hypothetical protein F0344_12350 [Streptomyces finlayi]
MTAPKQLAARVDAELARAIETLAPTGLTYSEIVKRAVAQFAEVYRVAVDNKVAEPHEVPILTAYRYQLPPRWQPPRTGAINLPSLTTQKD